jgi:hypothetical protein
MQGKITLITPPDIFENESTSILFMHLSDNDQEKVSSWFANSEFKENINVYFYDQEIDVTWLFFAAARCEYKFIDLDYLNHVTTQLSGYLLGKKNTFYKTDNDITAEISQHLNQNRITNIESFLERIFNVKP